MDVYDFDRDEWIYVSHFQQIPLQSNEFYFDHTPNFTPPDGTTTANTPSSSDSLSGTQLVGPQTLQSKKRRYRSEESESAALRRTRKPRKLGDRQETAKIREKGACFFCQKKRKKVNFVYQFEIFVFRFKLITLT
jgi:hypothetical protein